VIIPQIDYTAKDFSALKSELTKVIKQSIPDWSGDSESDFGVALVNAFSYMGDLMSYYIDRAANEANIQTTTQLSNLINFAETYGYSPSGPVPSSVYATLINNTGSLISLPIGTQIKVTPSSGPYSTIYFELASALSDIADGSNSGPVIFNQVLTSNTSTSSGLDTNYYPLPVTLGTSDGYAYQELEIPETGVVDGSVVVWVGQSAGLTKWNYVDSLIDYGFTDKIYTTKIKNDGTTVILFGDGINGAVPNNGDPISATYQTSYGSYGNLSNTDMLTAVVSYVPGRSSVPSGLTVNPSSNSATDGADMEDMSQLRVNIQSAMQTRNRAVTLDDYPSLAVLVPGVARASATSSVYTIVNLYIQPYSNGTPTPGRTTTGAIDPLKFPALVNAVQNYVGTRCPINTTLTINPPTYVPIFISANLVVSDNYKALDAKVNVASRLLNQDTGLFSYNGYGFGDDIYQADIYRTLMNTPGVNNVTFNYLCSRTQYTINTQTPSGTTNITLSTSTPHGFSVGDSVVISGVTPDGYNGTFTTQTGTTSSTLVVNINSNPGAITVGGLVYKAPSGNSNLNVINTQTPTYANPNITLSTAGNHGLSIGDSVTISGVTPSGYNGTWTAQTGTNGSTLVVNIGSNPGAITVAGTVYKTTSDITINTNEIPYLTRDRLVLTTTGGI